MLFPPHYRGGNCNRENMSYCHLRFGRSRANFIISHFFRLIYINGILIISIPRGTNFDIGLLFFFPFLSFPLSGMSPCQLFLQHISYMCHCLSIITSNALMLAHFPPGSLDYSSILWLSPRLRRGGSEEATRLFLPRKINSSC